MSQTDTTETNSDERIRKIFAKDLKVGETVHTVFRAARKDKHTSRGGKSYLALTMVDRTGEVDGRVFDNVDAADQAFSVDDYLLVKGKIGAFHGKTQIVIDQLERLSPEPIDPADFAYTPAPPPPAPARDEPRRDEEKARVRLTRRLERLMEIPQFVQALDNFVGHLEKAIAAVGPRPEKPERAERPERKPRGPRVEHKPRAEGEAPRPEAVKHEPKRDPSLPEGLAFKPFNALVGEGEGEAAETPKP